jgi:hypothetical protein
MLMLISIRNIESFNSQAVESEFQVLISASSATLLPIRGVGLF